MDKYVLVKDSKYYSEEENDFVKDISKAKKFETSGQANKKRQKLYKKIFGTILLQIVHEDSENILKDNEN